MQFSTLIASLIFGSAVSAHIAMTYPPPFFAAYNPHSVEAVINFSITSPLSADGSNFPCKSTTNGGILSPSSPGGQSVATWSAGGSYNVTTGSGALHGGGSCQLSLSFDSAKSFTVIHSYIGNCPSGFGASLDFTLPSDTPTGPAILYWSWQNKIGNREFYADCAAVTIEAAKRKTKKAAAIPFAQRPSPFVANLGNGCNTVETTDVNYPNPGPDVTQSSNDKNTITGTCAPLKGIGGGSSNSGSSGSSPAPAASSAVTISSYTTLATTISSSSPLASPPSAFSLTPNPPSPSSSYIAPAAASSSISSTPNSTLPISTAGSCNPATCLGADFGNSCSSFNYCGDTPLHYGTGCQPDFGLCQALPSAPSSANSTTTSAGNSLRSPLRIRWRRD